MKRIEGDTISEDENGAGKDGFTAGDPGGDPVVPPTIITADFLNDVQEEICNAITEQGITLSGADKGQLSDAIQNPATVTTASAAMNTLNGSTTDAIQIRAGQSSGVSAGATVSVSSTPGTIASPTSVVANTELGRVGFGGHNGTTWIKDACYLSAIATSTWSSSRSASMSLVTTNSGAPVTALTLSATGGATFANTVQASTLNATSGYAYVSTQTQNQNVALFNGTRTTGISTTGINNAVATVGTSNNALLVFSTTSSLLCPINLPNGATLIRVEFAMMGLVSGAVMTIELRTVDPSGTGNVPGTVSILRGRLQRNTVTTSETLLTVTPPTPIAVDDTNAILLALSKTGTEASTITMSTYCRAVYTTSTLTHARQG